jgi:hypothetical protein
MNGFCERFRLLNMKGFKPMVESADGVKFLSLKIKHFGLFFSRMG